MEYKQHLLNKDIRQICITSDVSLHYILDDYNGYKDIEALKLHSFDNFPIIEINTNNLKELKIEIESLLDNLFFNRKTTLDFKSLITNIFYQGKQYDLDFRNDYDFHIC